MHLIHLSLSIQATSFFFQAIAASTGQALEHSPHWVQTSKFTVNLRRATHRFAGHRFSTIGADIPMDILSDDHNRPMNPTDRF